LLRLGKQQDQDQKPEFVKHSVRYDHFTLV
jgi:hypothetical protein